MLNRLPPQNIEMEESLLCACLLSGMDDDTREAVAGLKEADFYRTDHQKVFSAIRDLDRQGVKPDAVAVATELKKAGLEHAGSVLHRVLEAPAAVSPGHSAHDIKQRAVLRQLIKIMTSAITDAHNPAGNATELVEGVLSKIMELQTNGNSSREDQKLDELLYSAITDLEARQGRGRGIPTGFHDLDRLTGGLQPSDLIVLAARPSMGKTALALNIADNVSATGVPVAVFSLEMSNGQLINRMFARHARINGARFKRADFQPDEWERIHDASQRIHKNPLIIADGPDLSISDIRSLARRLKAKHGVKIVMVDYLQLIRGDDSRSRVEEVSSISRGLKLLARELDVTVIALSQLNRALETRNNKRPTLADLRDSGAIEQDADLVAFIYRDEVYNPASQDKGTAELIISKHRNGELATVKLKFTAALTSFYDLARAA